MRTSPQRPRTLARAGALAALLALAGCAAPAPPARHLPTGAVLDPAGRSVALGSMPLAMAWSPDSSRVVVLLCGYREQGVQVVDPARGRVTQTLLQGAAFVGLAFAPDGRTLYASGGDRDVVYRYAWRADSAALVDSLVLAPLASGAHGRRYPAGLAPSPDGRSLYVAEDLGDSLAVVDLARGRVTQRLATGRYPYAVAVAPDGRVFVSAWGGSWVATFTPGANGLVASSRIAVGRHPSALALDPRGARLFVARAAYDRIEVVDTARDTVVGSLSDAGPGGPSEGCTPNGLTLDAAGRRLFVAEADANAAAVFALGATSARGRGGHDAGRLLGRVPAAWYPTAVLVRGGRLLVLAGKGLGSAANPRRSQPGTRSDRPEDPRLYTLGQTTGALTVSALPTDAGWDALSTRVVRANGWDHAPVTAGYPPFAHVIYVIKENRTYDQVLGDLATGDGDTALVYFPRAVAPNHHALAERFGIFDRFEVNAEVSGQGHDWSTAAYATDYVEKTIPSNYGGHGRTYDYEGLNRDTLPEDDVDEPGTGYLWDLAERAGITLRNYGEYTVRAADGSWRATKPWLDAHTDHACPGWDLDVPDQRRADAWLEEFRRYEAGGSLPALEILRLPDDHTAGAAAGKPTPRAFMADNDLALGRVIEALSHSRFWRSTVVFVLEDDSQDGPDHVDSHRSPLLVISAYNRPGVVHRFANTTDVIATIAGILHLGALSQYDHHGRTLQDVFARTPDTTAYVALTPRVPLGERNAADSTQAALASRRLDLSREDASDDDAFNRILWTALKGGRAYPAPARRGFAARVRGGG